MVIYGFAAMNRNYTGPSVRLALMQPNIRSDRRDPDAAIRDLRSIERLAAAFTQRPNDLTTQRPDIIIWPETIAPTDAVSDPFSRQVFSRMAQRTKAFVLAGTTYHDEQDRSYNSAALFTPDGRLATRYDKRWLVPMGEWVPLRSWMPFGDVFHFPSETTPGRVDTPVPAGSVRMSVLICYESVFPILPRIGASQGANLMVSITNDSWAGRSSELNQHLAMTVFRAVETRRCVASAATTGITGLIDPFGRVKSVPPYREDSLVTDAALLDGQTPYVRAGDWFVGLCGVCLAALLLRTARRA
jgi:apolipoprotein N-acyltransferase